MEDSDEELTPLETIVPGHLRRPVPEKEQELAPPESVVPVNLRRTDPVKS
jgi:hypothetical protein